LALVTDKTAETRLSLREVEDPAPSSSEAVVRVAASSLNRGEIKRLDLASDGSIPGWDLAGVVERAAEDGSGPPAGARVAGVVMAGAWAEQVAVPTSQLTLVPASMELHAAATVPLAGLTALGVLRQAGGLFGRRVAITGAAGGVGRYAVQLAARGGALVTAIVGSEERGAPLPGLGASEIQTELGSAGEDYDVVLESVGGESLARALGSVRPGGTVVAFGNSSGEATTFNVVGFYGRAPRARMVGFAIFDDLLTRGGRMRDLDALLAGVAAGTFDPGIALHSSWRELGPAFERLLAREVPGKVAIVMD
jgi:NADPH:quinone reductase-like Zn-dependent oxidoreductase